MTRYTELRHAGYYNDALNDQQRAAIAKQVDEGETRTDTPHGSTTFTAPTATEPVKASVKAAKKT